jgi:hypothetical protein
MDQPQRFYFTPEIETNIVSILWRRPEWLANFLQKFNPAHIQQPHLRDILGAINIVYGEMGSTDWALVLECLGELGRLEACGGRDGLNTVYEAYPEITEHTQKVFSHYLELLETYAKARASDADFPIARFSGGGGLLAANKIRRKSNDPDFLGELKVAGRLYRATAYAQNGGLEIRLLPK